MTTSSATTSSAPDPHQFRYAYLHGFASSPRALKGTSLAEAFAARGHQLHLPDLNRPSFAELSHDAMLAAVDELDRSTQTSDGDDGGDGGRNGGRNGPRHRPWRFIGSSQGGWLAARWAELHPDRVDRLVLLCPGFDLAERWPIIFGPEATARWQRAGSLPVADANGDMVPLHWGFMEEARRQPGTPAVDCATVIIHGRQDDVVPIDYSRRYVASRSHVRLLEVDDEHSLVVSLPVIAAEVGRFFDIELTKLQ